MLTYKKPGIMKKHAGLYSLKKGSAPGRELDSFFISTKNKKTPSKSNFFLF